MILGKLWRTLKAQLNKLANVFASSDPVAQMQYEYDHAVDQLRDGRLGLEQYRALVERVSRQVKSNRAQVSTLEAKIKSYLQSGDRETAARYALERQKAEKELAENEAQLAMHEQAYTNNLTKIQHASGKLAVLREKIQKYDAELKMSRAEAEMAQLARDFHFDITTDFGQAEQILQEQIGLNRAKARVAADLSGEGLADIQREQEMEKSLAEQALRDFESRAPLPAPAPAPAPAAALPAPAPAVEPAADTAPAPARGRKAAKRK
jgi:phage shock protein A